MMNQIQKHETNPYWLMDYLGKSGAHFVSSGMQIIGKSYKDWGSGAITHTIKTISVTLPLGASIKEIHPFIFNVDGLKGAGGEPTLIPWGYTPEQDIRWGLFHTPVTSVDENGRQRISVEYDNWSDVDSRAGFVIVEYTK